MKWACGSARSASRPCSFAFRRDPASRGVVASRGHFPATLGAAVRQKARWLGGIAFAGWDRLGWSGGLGERWMRLRDRRGPLAALLIVAAYMAAFLWSSCGSPKRSARRSRSRIDPLLVDLAHGQRLAARLASADARRLHRLGLRAGGRACSRCRAWSSAMSSPCLRPAALSLHSRGRQPRWDKTRHIFPARRLPR